MLGVEREAFLLTLVSAQGVASHLSLLTGYPMLEDKIVVSSALLYCTHKAR